MMEKFRNIIKGDLQKIILGEYHEWKIINIDKFC